MKERRKSSERLAPAAPMGGFRHGDRAEIPEQALMFRELKVLAALRAASNALSIRELARGCFPGIRARPGTYESTRSDGETVRHSTDAAYRAVLNAMRRLVAGGYAERVGRGMYAALRSNGVGAGPGAGAVERDEKEVNRG